MRLIMHRINPPSNHAVQYAKKCSGLPRPLCGLAMTIWPSSVSPPVNALIASQYNHLSTAIIAQAQLITQPLPPSHQSQNVDNHTESLNPPGHPHPQHRPLQNIPPAQRRRSEEHTS